MQHMNTIIDVRTCQWMLWFRKDLETEYALIEMFVMALSLQHKTSHVVFSYELLTSMTPFKLYNPCLPVELDYVTQQRLSDFEA